MTLDLGRDALHLLLLFLRQADLGHVSGVSDWENPELLHSTCRGEAQVTKGEVQHNGKVPDIMLKSSAADHQVRTG